MPKLVSLPPPKRDALHRILTGQSLTRGQLIAGGVFVVGWFAMDVIQFVDMIVGWCR